jgi:hypothetical protein
VLVDRADRGVTFAVYNNKKAPSNGAGYAKLSCEARVGAVDRALSGVDWFLEHRDLHETTLECHLAYDHI